MPLNETTRRALDPDNVRIGENLLAAFLAMNEKKAAQNPPEDRLEWRRIAEQVPVHPVTLSKAVAGRVGLSESKIVRLAELLGVPPGRLIAGVARQDRFRHIPAANNRNRDEIAKKGMSVSSIDSLLKHDYLLSSFLGGVDRKDIKLFNRLLMDIREMAREKRQEAIKEKRFDPVKRKFIGE